MFKKGDKVIEKGKPSRVYTVHQSSKNMTMVEEYPFYFFLTSTFELCPNMSTIDKIIYNSISNASVDAVGCDCGAEKNGWTHSYWCLTANKNTID